MHPAHVEEFRSVDAVLDSGVATAGVDAFALSLLKVERQARRLVTYLVFQYPCFGRHDVPALRKLLAENSRVYFKGFLVGFDTLYPRPLEQLVGAEFSSLKARLDEASGHRNKLFHGQLTVGALSRTELFAFVADLRRWSELLSEAAESEIGYSGFGRSSFCKAEDPNLSARLNRNVQSLADYESFIVQVLQR
ncbi:hypothetical protein [Roseateles noduli]|uniref:hypothetical protein n=1 Tax=Roseateles noduli TaxID=2052484 RepID=UPI003D64A679